MKIPYLRAKERHDLNKQHVEPTLNAQAVNYSDFSFEIPGDLAEAIKLSRITAAADIDFDSLCCKFDFGLGHNWSSRTVSLSGSLSEDISCMLADKIEKEREQEESTCNGGNTEVDLPKKLS